MYHRLLKIDIYFLLPFLLFSLLFISACGDQAPAKESGRETSKELRFESRMIVDSARFWWAHCPVEINNDGIVDLVFINNNAAGGYLGYYEGRKDTGLWTLHIIAEAPPTGGLFASGDLECEDMDGDGDIDVLAVKHPGEWQDAGAPADLFWYENPSWKVHTIGTVPDAVKDVSFSDFDRDGKMDLAVMTFNESTLSVFRQEGKEPWERVQFLEGFGNLHEGMGIGDVNGDRFPDIIANAWIFYNPGGKLQEDWQVENLDPKWNNQEGDWSRNATKAYARDLDGDERMEVFISHSERAGYPLAWYQKKGDRWVENIIADSIPACHTLQVFDFDLDGDYDVLAGINRGRAVNLYIDHFEVTVFLSDDNYQSWTPMVVEDGGIYNGQAADYDGDGDMDFFRYPDHEAKEFFVFENLIK